MYPYKNIRYNSEFFRYNDGTQNGARRDFCTALNIILYLNISTHQLTQVPFWEENCTEKTQRYTEIFEIFFS